MWFCLVLCGIIAYADNPNCVTIPILCLPVTVHSSGARLLKYPFHAYNRDYKSDIFMTKKHMTA